MSGIKKTLAAVLILMILSVTAAGMAWHSKYYCIVDFRVYPRDAAVLDLRGENVSVAHYQKIHRKLPKSKILWNIPLQGEIYPQDTEELTVTRLNSRDLEAIRCFQNLKTLNAGGCTDYDLLIRLQEEFPEARVLYTVTVSGQEYAQDADTILVDGLTREEADALAYLPQLREVRLESGKDPGQLEALLDYCDRNEIAVRVKLGGKYYARDITQLRTSGLTQDQLALLTYLPQLQSVSLEDPQAEAQGLFALADARPEVKFTWNKPVLGVSYPSDSRQLDLTGAISAQGAAACAYARTDSVHGEHDEEVYLFAIREKYPLPDLTANTAELIAQVEAALAYFPNLEKVVMGGSLLDNEAMAAFRERHREDYRVVWTVQCGKMAVRTDSPYFMPTKYHVYYFNDEDSLNLRYCEDMISVDLGHMSIKSIEWAAYMPNLEYLVLAHTDVRSIEPIRNCKKLRFLELDWSAVQDYTPLKECTALEDLNLGNTNRDFTPIGEMTWLKHLWMVGCNSGAAYRMTQALPNTIIMASGSATVANGWRELPNYYAMRDIMNMYYMEW